MKQIPNFNTRPVISPTKSLSRSQVLTFNISMETNKEIFTVILHPTLSEHYVFLHFLRPECLFVNYYPECQCLKEATDN